MAKQNNKKIKKMTPLMITHDSDEEKEDEIKEEEEEIKFDSRGNQ